MSPDVNEWKPSARPAALPAGYVEIDPAGITADLIGQVVLIVAWYAKEDRPVTDALYLAGRLLTIAYDLDLTVRSLTIDDAPGGCCTFYPPNCRVWHWQPNAMLHAEFDWERS